MIFQKKNKSKEEDRKIILLPAAQYESIIVIIDKAEQIRHNQLHKLFPVATFSFLTTRSEKEDKSSGQNYTFRSSDRRFGMIKNERLKELLQRNFDLLIDLSDQSKLSLFSKIINANLKVGVFDKEENFNFDLLIKKTDAVEQMLESIAGQLNILTLNKNT